MDHVKSRAYRANVLPGRRAYWRAAILLTVALASACSEESSTRFVSCAQSVLLDGEMYVGWDVTALVPTDALGEQLATVTDSRPCRDLYDNPSPEAESTDEVIGWTVPEGSQIRAIRGEPISSAIAVTSADGMLMMTAVVDT